MLIYGNPSYESVMAIKNSILLREWIKSGILDPLKILTPPCEITTQEELHGLVLQSRTVTPDRMQEIQELEDDMFSCWARYLQSLGITTTAEEIKSYTDLYDPIIDYLKVIYNRPRPFQTAAYYGIPLYPRLKTDASSSAYPSGHTLLSLFIYHKFSQTHPDLKMQLMQYVLNVKSSREEGGVHYPSDGLFSFQIYRHIRPYMNAQDTFTI